MSDDTEGLMLTRASIQRIDRVVNAVEHSPLLEQPYAVPPANPQSMWYWAKLVSGMAAGSLTSPQTFTFDVWVPDDASGSTPPPFVVTTDSDFLGMTGTNRSEMYTTSGKMIKVEYAFGEWSPKWADCPT